MPSSIQRSTSCWNYRWPKARQIDRNGQEAIPPARFIPSSACLRGKRHRRPVLLPMGPGQPMLPLMAPSQPQRIPHHERSPRQGAISAPYHPRCRRYLPGEHQDSTSLDKVRRTACRKARQPVAHPAKRPSTFHSKSPELVARRVHICPLFSVSYGVVGRTVPSNS